MLNIKVKKTAKSMCLKHKIAVIDKIVIFVISYL